MPFLHAKYSKTKTEYDKGPPGGPVDVVQTPHVHGKRRQETHEFKDAVERRVHGPADENSAVSRIPVANLPITVNNT